MSQVFSKLSGRVLLPLLCSVAIGSATLAQTREATMYITCYSLAMPPATSPHFGGDLQLSFTNPGADEINNEWFVSPDASEITSLLVLDTPLGQISTDCSLRTPYADDLDLNLLTDFYEVSKEVATATTTGGFLFDDGMDVYPGTLKATWNRAAGVTTGSCQLVVNAPDLGIVNATFNHSFEILQYKGTLNYTVVGTNVNASVLLHREGGNTDFTGPWPLRQISESELMWDVAQWTGPGDSPFQVLASDAIEDAPFSLDRFGSRTSDFYLGVLLFADGNPGTPFTDEYEIWEIVAIDPNDGDGDEVPDLSDLSNSVNVGPPPNLTVRLDQGHLMLRVTGKAGQAVTLEQRTSLTTGEWVPGQTLTLASDTQEFDLGVPASSVFFVRGKL